jgi:trans-2,3-dihydro-3-hydroxyanthranilate isomerase
MNRYKFLQLDVFTNRPFGGNQLAVFTDARGLSGAQMQDLAREMNFSETTFVLPAEIPGAARKVRIFTPSIEMPMAGHPTVGTAAALLQRGLVELPPSHALTLELGIGAVQVDVEPRPEGAPFVWMSHRMPQFSPYERSREAVASELGLEVEDVCEDPPLEIVSTGVPFLFVPLVSLDAIGRARSEKAALNRLFEGIPPANMALFTQEVVGAGVDVHARMYSPHLAGISEDPATGSMAAPLGAYLAKHAVLPQQALVTFAIEQGLEMQRPSLIRVEVRRNGAEIIALRIGGESVIVGEGEIFWE